MSPSTPLLSAIALLAAGMQLAACSEKDAPPAEDATTSPVVTDTADDASGPDATDSGAPGPGADPLVGTLDIYTETGSVVCDVSVDIIADDAAVDCPDCDFQFWLAGTVAADHSDPDCHLDAGLDFAAATGAIGTRLQHEVYVVDASTDDFTRVLHREVDRLSMGPEVTDPALWNTLWEDGYRYRVYGENTYYDVIDTPDATFEWSADAVLLSRDTTETVREWYRTDCSPSTTAAPAPVPTAPVEVGTDILNCEGAGAADVWEVQLPADTTATFWFDNVDGDRAFQTYAAVTSQTDCVADVINPEHPCTHAEPLTSSCASVELTSTIPETIWLQVADYGCIREAPYTLSVEGIDPARVRLAYDEVDAQSEVTVVRRIDLSLAR